MGFINRLFLKGLIVVMPLSLTLYVFILISTKAESIFADTIKSFIGVQNYIPGLGIIVAFFAIVLVGFLVSNFITGKVIQILINYFERVPFIKAIYLPLKDLMSLFAGESQKNLKKVVLVQFDSPRIKTIGLVTREDFKDVTDLISSDEIAVYIPYSYMIGGYTAIVSRSQITEIDIPVDQAFKLAITGWIKSDD